jgi:cell division protein FtsQ
MIVIRLQGSDGMGDLEPFHHRSKNKGSMSARKFTGLLLALFVLIVGFLLIKSSYFKVGAVVVEGNHYIPVEDVYRIAEIPEPLNIFSLNTADIKMHLLHDLRIAEVDVSRRFPGTIVISIKERKPMAYIASGYGFSELDQQGVVLAAFKNLKQINVPMITSVRLDNEYVGDQVENPTIKNVLKYLSLLDETILSQISEVNVKSPEQIVAYTVKSVHLRLGNSDKLVDQAKLTNDILHEISEKKMNVEYVDLTYSSPFIKMKQ